MTFEQWKVALAIELEKRFGMQPFEGSSYIANCGAACWREMYDDGLTPADAASEEAEAAAGCAAEARHEGQ